MFNMHMPSAERSPPISTLHALIACPGVTEGMKNGTGTGTGTSTGIEAEIGIGTGAEIITDRAAKATTGTKAGALHIPRYSYLRTHLHTGLSQSCLRCRLTMRIAATPLLPLAPWATQPSQRTLLHSLLNHPFPAQPRRRHPTPSIHFLLSPRDAVSNPRPSHRH